MRKTYTGKELKKLGYDESTWISIDDRLWTILKIWNQLPHEFFDAWNWNYEFSNSIINNDNFVYSKFKHPTYFINWISILWAMAYFVYTNDFILGLTAKYRKTYNWEYGSSYNDIIEWNIINNSLKNIQIEYLGREGWNIKGIKNVELFLYLQKNISNKELQKIYLSEQKLIIA